MPKKSPPSLADEIRNAPAATPVVVAPVMPPAPDLSEEIIERLDTMVEHLRRIDRRDRLRMVGSTFKGLISLGMLGFVIWSSLYLALHMEDFIKMATEQAAKATMEYSKTGSEDLMKQVQEMMKQP